MIVSPNKLVSALTKLTCDALNNNSAFISNLVNYPFADNCFYDGKFHLWDISGTRSEIERTILTMGSEKPIVGSKTKLPSLFNFLPLEEKIVTNNGVTTHHMSLNIAICASTKSDWITKERELFVFDTVLIPIYKELMRQIKKAAWFVNNRTLPNHSIYRVPTTGDTGGTLSKRYGEHIDAVEIHNFELIIKPSLCEKDIDEINTITNKNNN